MFAPWFYYICSLYLYMLHYMPVLSVLYIYARCGSTLYAHSVIDQPSSPFLSGGRDKPVIGLHCIARPPTTVVDVGSFGLKYDDRRVESREGLLLGSDSGWSLEKDYSCGQIPASGLHPHRRGLRRRPRLFPQVSSLPTLLD